MGTIVSQQRIAQEAGTFTSRYQENSIQRIGWTTIIYFHTIFVEISRNSAGYTSDGKSRACPAHTELSG